MTHKIVISKYLDEFPDEVFCTESIPQSTSDLRCPICRNVMYDSLRCPQDCAYCRACIEKSIKLRRTCPCCAVPMLMENYSVNRRLNNIIGELKVVCKESKQMSTTITTKKRKRTEKEDVVPLSGEELDKAVVDETIVEELRCTWTGSLKDLDHHLSTTCQFMAVKCKLCYKSMKRYQLDQHMVIHALKPCPACQEMVPGGNHEQVCKKRFRDCYYCSVSFSYDDYASHLKVCDMVRVECPYRSITACNHSCLRRDMPAHSSDFSQHMPGLFQTLLVQHDTISELCNSQCESAVDELAREIAYPLYEMLETNLDDIGFYQNNSDLHRRLSIIWELMPINEVMNSDDYDTSNDSDSDFFYRLPVLPVATALGIKERRRINRIYLLNHTPCAKLLSNILAKSELFTEAQLKMTLSVLRALFFTNGGTPGFGFEVSLENLGIEKFAKSALQPRYKHPQLIEPALSALGQCLIAYLYDNVFQIELYGIIERVMSVIIKWLPGNVSNEGYMRGVAIVVTGVLSKVSNDICDVVGSRVFEVFAALLKNQNQSTSIIYILTQGFSDWVIYPSSCEDYDTYYAFLDDANKTANEEPVEEDDDTSHNWPYLMEEIATNGLCEILVEIAESHCNQSARKSAKVVTDWLGDASRGLSTMCAERVADALQKFSSTSSSSSSSSSSLPDSTVVVG